MNDDQSQRPDNDPTPAIIHEASQPPPEPSQRSRIVSKIFLNPSGIRSGWRLLIFFVLFFLCARIILLVFPRFLRLGAESLAPGPMFVREALSFLAALVAAAIMGIFERRSFSDYLLPWRSAFKSRFWWGALWGLLALSAVVVAIRFDHGFVFGHLALVGIRIPYEAFGWALVFIMVGLSEEFTFRGYPLFTLTTGIGFWPAAIVLSGAFGAVHLANPGEDWAGALSAGLIGIFFCFTVRRTGSLWFAVGLHAMWDYTETFLYSVPNSGLVAKGHLLSSSFHGPHWLTGGSVGPEGSIFACVLIGILFLVFHHFYPEARFPRPEQSAG